MHSRDVDYKLLLNVRMTRTSLLCCSWYCLAVQVLAGVQPLRDIRYALFTSGPEGDFDSSGAIPAIELAEEEIFNDPSILVGYSLTHTPIKDTQVRPIITCIISYNILVLSSSLSTCTFNIV